MDSQPLLIIGASVRAAAFSALRAGLQPHCVDLFADADLQRRCPATRLTGRYPHAFVEVVRNAPPGPWMYTGGLENWPRLVGQLAQLKPLWGNTQHVLASIRQPELVRASVQGTSHVMPEVSRQRPLPSGRRWLVKPLRGAGGSGIHFLDAPGWAEHREESVYFQEYIEGESYAVLYVGDGFHTFWPGVTRQLVGEPWLNAAPFHYCGSLGPVSLDLAILRGLGELGYTLARTCKLRGLFGVDGMVRDGVFWVVEVNPRYTASVEVLEYATGWPSLSFHRGVCQDQEDRCQWLPRGPYPCVGKAILFARDRLVFPAAGPWEGELTHPCDITELPAFADIPHPGEHIEAGRPVLTFFARARTAAACLDMLQQIARELNAWLFG